MISILKPNQNIMSLITKLEGSRKLFFVD